MRKSWDNYFMEIALLASRRATCNRLKVGAVLVKDKRVIATGYNGSPSGMPHCIDEGCSVVNGHCIRTIHAEQNALFQCAKFGVSTKGATCYVTHLPCLLCAKSLIQSGIVKVVFLQYYKPDGYTQKIFADTRVKLQRL